jgi:aspartyl-tRNA(Asn)/glutamyl-tRNA(Gln) amidotransferase subunit B
MKVVRETRRFDEERKVTMPAREKETEEDYGYIGEPDLGTYDLTAISASVSSSETPLKRAQRIAGHYVVDLGKARQIVLTSMKLADLLERLAEVVEPEFAMTWTLGPISSNWTSIEPRLDETVTKDIVEVVRLVSAREITDSEGRRRIAAIAAGECPADASCAVEDSALDELISKYLDEHPNVVKDYASNPRAANAAIGFVMKESKGRYNSEEVVKAVRKEIERRR